MTSSPLSNFTLTPQQQTLLFTALNSNRPTSSPQNGLSLSPSSLTKSPATKADQNGFQDSPFLDYDYSFDGADTSFDSALFDNDEQGRMIGELPGTTEGPKSVSTSTDGNDSPEKRSHPDDEEDENDNGAKRRESTEKVPKKPGRKLPKKPGRKPLTSEPTSKRKAQNRAAQRAFRERKEKHVKDLETKVEELEKASQAANSENSNLRTENEKLTIELREYKRRLAIVTANRPQTASRAGFGNSMVNTINDVNFQFEFPKFGALPGLPPKSSGRGGQSRASSLSQTPSLVNSPNGQASAHASPRDSSRDNPTPSSSYSIGLEAQPKDDVVKLSGFFNIPNMPLTNTNVANASRGSMDSHYSAGPASTSSPSASSHSNMGPSSSCGTSPEPYTQSPMGFKPVDTLATIGEEASCVSNSGQGAADLEQFSSIDVNELDWLASANNYQFDPQLFGDYRESQENIVGNAFGDSFFNDAWEIDFTTPFNMPPGQAQPKKDLISQIDAAKEADDDVVGGSGELLTCNRIWEQLQNCPKVQNGDFDLDGLCSELQKKAKCSGHGAVVNEKDFQEAMKKYIGKPDDDLRCQGSHVKSATAT